MNNLGFWENLKKPFFVLAPMADVTDPAFRQIIAKYGKPDVTWTEFVSADGLAHSEGRKNLLLDLKYTEGERPVVAQIFGSNEKNIELAAGLCEELGFDGVDINMGCPDKNINKQGAGTALIKNKEKAIEIIRAAKRGVFKIPVSVKTRIGYSKKEEMEEWVRAVLEEGVAVLTMHFRTKTEMSKVPADWSLMKDILRIKKELGSNALIVGNGDVYSIKDAKEKADFYGCDGVMLGRAVFGKPWLFSGEEFSIKKRLKVLREHILFFDDMLGETKSFAVMKKHFKAYLNGYYVIPTNSDSQSLIREVPKEVKDLRMKLMEVKDKEEAVFIIDEFIKAV